MKFPYLDNSLRQSLKLHFWPVALLIVASAAVFYRILGHEFLMTWDDRLYVVHNEAVQGFSWQHIKTVFSSYYVGNYAPVQMLSYMLDYKLWGMRPGGFLFTNLLIHTFNGLLVYRLFIRCHNNILLATVGALIFLIHPVQVESVAWISQRKNLLSMFFFLLAWLAYCRYREETGSKRLSYYGASFAAFSIALLAKSVVVIFPVIIIIFDLCYPVKNSRLRLLDKIPYILAAVVVTALTIHSQAPVTDDWDGAVGGGLTGYHGGSILATSLTMTTVFCRYLGLLVWPVNLSAEYDPAIHHSIDATVLGACCVIAAAGFLSARLFKVDRKIGFWPLVFLIGLLPVSQVVPLITMMNDRYLYFPMLGVAALAGAGATLLRDRLRTWHGARFYFLLALPLILLSVLSFQRVAIWQNDIEFSRDTVARCPTKYVAWEGLGEACYFSIPPHYDEAVQAYTRALELDPRSKLTLYNLGVLYVEMGDYDKGYELLKNFVFI